jgi:hypothetical protein
LRRYIVPHTPLNISLTCLPTYLSTQLFNFRSLLSSSHLAVSATTSILQVPLPIRNNTSRKIVLPTPAPTTKDSQTMASAAAKTLLRDFTTTGQAYETGDPDSRLKLLELCKELTAELETPGETFMRMNWAEVRSILCDIVKD